MNGFQKKRLGALIIGSECYKYRRFIEFGAFLVTIWYFVTFVGEIFQVFLLGELRKDIWGNYFFT